MWVHMKQTRGPHCPLPCLWQASAVSQGQNLHQAPQGTFPSCPQDFVVLFPCRPLICLKNIFTLLTLKNVPEKCLLLPPTDILLGRIPQVAYAVWSMAPASVGTIPLFHEGQYFPVSEAFSQLPPFRKRWSKIKQPPLCQSYLPCGLVPRPLASCCYCSGTTVVGGSKGSGRLLRGRMCCFI